MRAVLAAALALAAASAAAEPKAGQKALDFPQANTHEAAVLRGSLVFNNYCVLCHGATADGNGRAAKLYNPRPANLRKSDKNDDYKALIIRLGGAAIGRSEFMPPWGAELTSEQIGDVVAFLGSVLDK